MKKVQQGFTLIELMIVVAIIGILAAIAVPAYQDYTIKSRVSEAASMASAARTAIDVAYSEGFAPGSFPVSMGSLGLDASGHYQAKYVTSVRVGSDQGEVVVRLRNDSTLGLATAAGGEVTYTPTAQGGNLSWAPSCSWGAKYCPKN
jgi:type IV pilus assembly protein PilA